MSEPKCNECGGRYPDIPHMSWCSVVTGKPAERVCRKCGEYFAEFAIEAGKYCHCTRIISTDKPSINYGRPVEIAEPVIDESANRAKLDELSKPTEPTNEVLTSTKISNKPAEPSARDYWIDLDSEGVFEKCPDNTYLEHHYVHHVVVKCDADAAYDRVVKELNQWKSSSNAQANAYGELKDKYDRVEAQLAKAEGELHDTKVKLGQEKFSRANVFEKWQNSIAREERLERELAEAKRREAGFEVTAKAIREEIEALRAENEETVRKRVLLYAELTTARAELEKTKEALRLTGEGRPSEWAYTQLLNDFNKARAEIECLEHECKAKQEYYEKLWLEKERLEHELAEMRRASACEIEKLQDELETLRAESAKLRKYIETDQWRSDLDLARQVNRNLSEQLTAARAEIEKLKSPLALQIAAMERDRYKAALERIAKVSLESEFPGQECFEIARDALKGETDEK